MGLEDFLVARMFLLTDQQGDILFCQKTAENLFGGDYLQQDFFFFVTPINQIMIRGFYTGLILWHHRADICICRSTYSANSAETILVSKEYDRLREFY